MRRALPAVVLLALLAAGCASPAAEPLQTGDQNASESAAPQSWADPDSATIRPGMPIHTPKRDCPSNFLFIRPDNSSIFLGSTAWCFRDLPIGTLVTVGGPENIGTLIYSSFQTMADLQEKDSDALEYNDFAVIKIDEGSRKRTSPSMVDFGGPAGLGKPGELQMGDRVIARGNASLVEWRQGVVTGRAGDWALLVHSPVPITPGDMGGAVLGEDGSALGIVVNLGLKPNPGANGVARLDTLMKYAEENARLYMQLEGAPLTGN